MPRRPIGERPLSVAERSARKRERKAALVQQIDEAAEQVEQLGQTLRTKVAGTAPEIERTGTELVEAAGRVATLSREIAGAGRRKREE